MSSAATIRMCHCGVAHAEGIPCDQVMVPTEVASIRSTFGERLSVWPTALAVWYLSRQLQRDKAFRDSWQANIAMPIYDATRPQCLCHLTEENFHKWDCEQMRGRTASECRDMPATQANYIADKIMEHLFDA